MPQKKKSKITELPSEKGFVNVLLKAESMEPDYEQYKPVRPMVKPAAWIMVRVPESTFLGYNPEDGLPVLSLEGWAHIQAELRFAQKKIYG